MALGVNPAFESVSAVLSHFHINTTSIDIPSSVFLNILIALLLSVLYFVFLIGVAGVLGAFLGMLIGVAIGTRIQDDTEDTLKELATVIQNAQNLQVSEETKSQLGILFLKSQTIQERLHKRWANRIARWTRKKQKGKQK